MIWRLISFALFVAALLAGNFAIAALTLVCLVIFAHHQKTVNTVVTNLETTK